MITIETYYNHCEIKGISSHWKRQEICEKALKDVLSMPINLAPITMEEKHNLVLYAINSRIELFKSRYQKRQTIN